MSATTQNVPYPQSPVLTKTDALLCLVLNAIVPGVGTIAGGVMGRKPLIGRGIAQLLLAVILVGWIWGIVTGVQMLHNAMWREDQAQPQARASA